MQERWREPGFVSCVHGWIDDRLDDLGRTRTGDVEQPHVTDWSTVMRVPTDAGTVWFKANDDTMLHEAAVLEVVAARSSGRVPAPLVRDPRTGWMLLDDGGQRLREVIAQERSLVRWHDVLGAYARVQIACEDVVDELSVVRPDLVRGVRLDLRRADVPRPRLPFEPRAGVAEEQVL